MSLYCNLLQKDRYNACVQWNLKNTLKGTQDFWSGFNTSVSLLRSRSHAV